MASSCELAADELYRVYADAQENTFYYEHADFEEPYDPLQDEIESVLVAIREGRASELEDVPREVLLEASWGAMTIFIDAYNREGDTYTTQRLCMESELILDLLSEEEREQIILKVAPRSNSPFVFD